MQDFFNSHNFEIMAREYNKKYNKTNVQSNNNIFDGKKDIQNKLDGNNFIVEKSKSFLNNNVVYFNQRLNHFQNEDFSTLNQTNENYNKEINDNNFYNKTENSLKQNQDDIFKSLNKKINEISDLLSILDLRLKNKLGFLIFNSGYTYFKFCELKNKYQELEGELTRIFYQNNKHK